MEYDWARILSTYGPDVWRILRCLLGHDADARDCYQTVFLEALQFSRKRSIDDWGKFLHRIARVRALDLLRKRYRVAARIDTAADPGSAESRVPAPDDEAEAAELADQLRDGLALLPQQQAETFVMRFVEQLSYDEIAERTGSNRNAVGAMLNRARTQLRQHLEEDSRDAVKVRREPYGQ
jgi:RNA polymerase sigma-70 factor (ECF subfamily)